MKSKFKAMVLSCMDPRFQHLVQNHLKKKKLTEKYSAFTIAGAAVGSHTINLKNGIILFMIILQLQFSFIKLKSL
jgi:hypothetical protein